MPRNGSGVYSLPAGYEATTGQTAAAAQHNDPLEDVRDDLNAARPVVAGGTGATSVSAAQANLGVLVGTDVQPADATLSMYAVYGGTANDITLTTAVSLASLTTGQEFRFRATAANTGAMTIDVDGIGAVAGRTATGAAVPAGYIRTDVDTIGRYNGSNIVLSRAVETGSGSGGSWIKHENGVMECAIRVLTLTRAAGTSCYAKWTFEQEFSSTTDLSIQATLRPEFNANTTADLDADCTPSADEFGALGFGNLKTESVDFRLYRVAGTTDFAVNDEVYISARASGYWY